MSYLLVLWESDNSVSVVNKGSKSVVSINERDILFRWPRKGTFKGSIISSSDSKKEMERKAKEMVSHEGENEDTEDSAQAVASSSTSKSGSSNVAKTKKTTDTPKTTTTKRKRKKVSADIQACNAAAMAIFNNLKQMEQNQHDNVRAKIKPLDSVQQSSTIPDVSTPSVTSISDSESEYSEISPYEAAALQRREENRNLLESLGLIKESTILKQKRQHEMPLNENKGKKKRFENPGDSLQEKREKTSKDKRRIETLEDHTHPIAPAEKREKIPVQKIELVKNMGVLIKSSALAAVLRKSKRTPTRVLRLLMEELFTVDELRCSTVRGKRGSLPALDIETMDAILCFTMGKAEEWGQPITEEALVRQGNEKCYSYRRK